MPTYLPDFIQRVRSQSNVPLAVGFGISTPEQAQSIAAYADGVIIGSQLLRLIEADPSLNQLHQFVEQVRAQLNAGGNVG
jgi:tryptophan synthase alpha chain